VYSGNLGDIYFVHDGLWNLNSLTACSLVVCLLYLLITSAKDAWAGEVVYLAHVDVIVSCQTDGRCDSQLSSRHSPQHDDGSRESRRDPHCIHRRLGLTHLSNNLDWIVPLTAKDHYLNAADRFRNVELFTARIRLWMDG